MAKRLCEVTGLAKVKVAWYVDDEEEARTLWKRFKADGVFGDFQVAITSDRDECEVKLIPDGEET